MADDGEHSRTHNAATMNQELGSAFERFKALETERQSIVEDMAEIVKGVSEKFNLKPKNVRKAWMLAIKPPEPADLNEIDVVTAALGDFVSTPLGGATVGNVAGRMIDAVRAGEGVQALGATLAPGNSMTISTPNSGGGVKISKDEAGKIRVEDAPA